jgi:hypothetical protein
MFSLAALGGTFSYIPVFVWSVNLPHRNVIVITDMATGFVGLESHLMIKGWRKNHIVVVLPRLWASPQSSWHAGFTWLLGEARTAWSGWFMTKNCSMGEEAFTEG